MLKFRVLRAIDDVKSTQKYLEGYRKVLESYGITQVTSADQDWTNSSDAFIIIVESVETGTILGGARIQIAGKMPLPIETAVGSKDPNIYKLIKEDVKTGGTGEVCGLWNSRKIAGYGVGSVFLVRVCIAVANLLNINSLWALCSPATVRISMRVGYTKVVVLGNNGTFYYPKEDLIATTLKIVDLNELSSAAPYDRERILDLRNRPEQESTEVGPKGELKIKYNLKLY